VAEQKRKLADRIYRCVSRSAAKTAYLIDASSEVFESNKATRVSRISF